MGIRFYVNEFCRAFVAPSCRMPIRVAAIALSRQVSAIIRSNVPVLTGTEGRQPRATMAPTAAACRCSERCLIVHPRWVLAGPLRKETWLLLPRVPRPLRNDLDPDGRGPLRTQALAAMRSEISNSPTIDTVNPGLVCRFRPGIQSALRPLEATGDRQASHRLSLLSGQSDGDNPRPQSRDSKPV